ncbi:LOW QUALITY PROTEIN: uncharacterized protein LOC134166665 [Pezoporus occidentalis]|uniref:LOW QUALITY PROTEIN: uncharacterized protein LOC134166665 n=1 Tax=Pezoporus occidentalis TaxID=407982 RepID=UPI002F91A7E6
MLIYWLSILLLLISQFQHVVPYLQLVFAVLVFNSWGPWAKFFVSLYFMVITCNTGRFRQQGRMDVAVDLYLAVPLLFTILALILASIFVKLWGAEGELPQEPSGQSTQKSGPGDQAAAREGMEARRERLPVEEVGAVEKGKEKAAKQWEEAAEEPSPVAKPSPAAAESTLQQLPAEPREPEPQDDVESKIPPLGASAGSSLGHPGQVEDAGDHTALSSKAEDLDSEKEKLVTGN